MVPKTILILACCGTRDILSRTSESTPLSCNHLSAFSFPVDQAAGAGLVEEIPASRSEIRRGVLLRPGDAPAPPAEFDVAEFRELPASEGGKVNIGVAKIADVRPGHHSDP